MSYPGQDDPDELVLFSAEPYVELVAAQGANPTAAEDALVGLARDLVEEIAQGRAIEIARSSVPPAPRDDAGQFQPPSPRPSSGWSHTLRNPANRAHLLGSDRFMRELYGRGAAGVVDGWADDGRPGEGAQEQPAQQQRGQSRRPRRRLR